MITVTAPINNTTTEISRAVRTHKVFHIRQLCSVPGKGTQQEIVRVALVGNNGATDGVKTVYAKDGISAVQKLMLCRDFHVASGVSGQSLNGRSSNR